MRLDVLTSTPPDGSAEARLRRKAREGDPRAFEEVVTSIGDVLHGAIYQILGDARTAREVFGKMVELAFADRHRCPRDTSLPEWLLRRALEAALKRAGAFKRERQIAEDDAYSQPVDSRRSARKHGWWEARRLRSTTAIGRALEQLPDRSRVILYLRYHVHLKVEHIARILELSAVQVSVSLFHALETVRRLRNLPLAEMGVSAGPEDDLDRSAYRARSSRCAEAREYLALLKDGTLDNEAVARYRSHLRNCAACLEYATDLGTVEQQIRGILMEERITIGALRDSIARALSPRRRKGLLGWLGGPPLPGLRRAGRRVGDEGRGTRDG